LTVFSPQFLKDGVATYETLQEGGYSILVVYVAQQIIQFRRKGEEFAMQHLGSNTELRKALCDVLGTLTPEEWREILTPEDRLEGLLPEERVKGLPPEERVKGLPPEERLKGLPPEERLKGLSLQERIQDLSAEDRKRLRELLQRPTNGEDSPRPE
jgi:hypothetical protein